MKNADEPAYPCNANETYYTEDLDGEPVRQTHTRRVNGLSKRERFAMAAMQGHSANPEYSQVPEAVIAENAIRVADRVLHELQKDKIDENTEES